MKKYAHDRVIMSLIQKNPGVDEGDVSKCFGAYIQAVSEFKEGIANKDSAMLALLTDAEREVSTLLVPNPGGLIYEPFNAYTNAPVEH